MDIDHEGYGSDAPAAEFPSMPPKVAKAMVEVMGGVKRLEKDEKNLHGNYKFTGIDSFLDAVRPLCAKAGLIITMDEESIDFRESSGKDGRARTWLVAKFRFTLSHESGETWQHRPTRTIMVDASMGSQSFGAAQSYALKQFQRAQFQIATGDNEDADTHPHADLPTKDRSPPAQIGKKPLIADKQLSKAQQDWVDKTCRELEAMSVNGVLDWEMSNQEAMDRMKAHNTQAWNRVRGMIVDKTADPETGERNQQ